MSAFQFLHSEDRHSTIEWFADAVKRRLKQASIENRQVNLTTGEVHHMLWTTNFYYDEKGNVEKVNSIARDITERKKFEEHLKAIAITDDLTGLLNRRGFFTLSEQQRKLVNRTKRHIAILYLDIDGFKNINDELGHKEGDNALIDTAGILKDTFRESDIIARIGGDEFAVLLTEHAGPDVENIMVEHLRENVKAFNDKGVRKYQLLFSIGIAGYDSLCPCSIDELLMRADDLMYKEKKHRIVQDISVAFGSNDERREYERYSPVKNIIVEIDGTFTGEIKDISYSGACLMSAQRINADDVHKIKIDNLSVKGLIVWSCYTGDKIREEKGLPGYETGFRFIDLEHNKKSLLKRLIKELAGEA
jgi:diguanylate cyclase (GGDEF)-like protein